MEEDQNIFISKTPPAAVNFISSSTTESSSDYGEFLSESEAFERGSDEEIVANEPLPKFSFLSSDSSTVSSTTVSPLINKNIEILNLNKQMNNEDVLFIQTDDTKDAKLPQREEEKSVKIVAINDDHAKTKPQLQPHAMSQNSLPSSSYSYSYYTSTTATSGASSITYSNASTSPIRFNNSPLRKHIKHMPKGSAHDKNIKHHSSNHHINKSEAKKYKMSQADKASDDYDSYYEEEDFMNSSDRRFIADSSSQSQIGNEPSLYRLLDMSQRKPNPKYKINKRKRLIDEYSPSQSDVDPSLSED